MTSNRNLFARHLRRKENERREGGENEKNKGLCLLSLSPFKGDVIYTSVVFVKNLKMPSSPRLVRPPRAMFRISNLLLKTPPLPTHSEPIKYTSLCLIWADIADGRIGPRLKFKSQDLACQVDGDALLLLTLLTVGIPACLTCTPRRISTKTIILKDRIFSTAWFQFFNTYFSSNLQQFRFKSCKQQELSSPF